MSQQDFEREFADTPEYREFCNRAASARYPDLKAYMCSCVKRRRRETPTPSRRA